MISSKQVIFLSGLLMLGQGLSLFICLFVLLSPLQANASNITMPGLQGHMLSAEEQLDNPISLVAIVLTALVVAFAAGGGSSAVTDEKDSQKKK